MAARQIKIFGWKVWTLTDFYAEWDNPNLGTNIIFNPMTYHSLGILNSCPRIGKQKL